MFRVWPPEWVLKLEWRALLGEHVHPRLQHADQPEQCWSWRNASPSTVFSSTCAFANESPLLRERETCLPEILFSSGHTPGLCFGCFVPVHIDLIITLISIFHAKNDFEFLQNQPVCQGLLGCAHVNFNVSFHSSAFA